MVFRLREARKLRGPHPDLSAHRSAPGPVPFAVTLMPGCIVLTPTERADQLQLSAIVAGLSTLRVTNGIDRIDPKLPIELLPLIGRQAITRGNSWRRRIWPVPLEIAREGQRYPEGWDGMCALLAEDARPVWQVGEFNALATRAVAATLTEAEAMDFWRANR